ncbi:serine/threonine-protein kinase ATG1 [Microdochium bolleyi]|uniref:non-specific serine/threonine protein kinase n=1 Tax=Microdochium bolleyi TaxID=196109 RepID=A0A136JJX8_9PEZI|nr:serine/threonine-protein kinase ATG1 [Microdochium bolleyi]
MADHRTSSGSSRRSRGTDDVVGNFVIGSEIGKGSFAQVYLGKHKVTGAAVAIKSVELGRLNKKLKENLYSEIKILKDLRHPHIVALHDCLESTTHINLIMEYCELGDLSLFIKKREKLITHPATCDMARKYPSVPNAGLNEVVIRHFMKQLASALQFLREGNFVHRDVKPQNLLLLPSIAYREANRDARPVMSASQDSMIPAVGLRSLPMLKLADFGFARVLPATSLAETLCGSPLYMAPEILRYERYDAKADLWSVGTVLYEMVCGRPPFRASNHVELLRKIENAEDQIRFSRDCQVSSETKSLVRALLKKNAVERMSFENFFAHPTITGDIPGLVEDDVPQVMRRPSTASRRSPRPDEIQSSLRRLSVHRRYTSDQDAGRQGAVSSSPREQPARQSPRLSQASEKYESQALHGASYKSSPPREEIAPGLGIRRPPPPAPSSSAPSRTSLVEDRRRRTSNGSLNRYPRDEPSSTYHPHEPAASARSKPAQLVTDEKEKIAQEIAFERDYVVVEKKHVEVNAFADELAAKGLQSQPLRAGHVTRRATQQGIPTSTTGAVPAQPSNALQIAQGRQQIDHYRKGSYDKNMSGSPNSTTSVISKAIQDASVRLFGFKYPSHLLGKGASPPHLYSPFPTTYPTLNTTTALITDGRVGGPLDEDARVAQCIEDYATRSDVVWGFAEVKYKQLVPLAPSMDHGLGGTPAENLGLEDEDGLTAEAVVVLSEEALVLYVKALSLLAKSMDIASSWWGQKARRLELSSSPTHFAAREAAAAQNLINRVNSAVQWIRRRFNETLEKAELVRLKLVEAQKQLPEDHPGHPDNHNLPSDVVGANSATADGIVLSSGLSAEKLMYERALEMSRAAAINEIANEDLAGCEISYVTAIRMLEAVLDHEDGQSGTKSRMPSSPLAERDLSRETASEMNQDDQQAVQKMIQMISGRLTALRKKMQMIANASKAQQSLTHRRSGDITPRSVPMSVS